MHMDTVGPGKDHADALISAFNCLLYVGGFIGATTYSWTSNRFGRRVPIALGAFFIVLGGALQAGEVDAAMLCVARIVIGLGIGNLLPGVPLYQAEVSPPHSRGLLVGLHGQSLYMNCCLQDG